MTKSQRQKHVAASTNFLLSFGLKIGKIKVTLEITDHEISCDLEKILQIKLQYRPQYYQVLSDIKKFQIYYESAFTTDIELIFFTC